MAVRLTLESCVWDMGFVRKAAGRAFPGMAVVLA